ncbi:hypothetical protein Dimus_022819 [Dionaea muscipula]
MAKDSFSTGKGCKLMPRFGQNNDFIFHLCIVNGSATIDAMIDTQNDSSANGLVKVNKKVGGRVRNKCKKVAQIQSANKLKIEFYQKRAVGKNQNEFSRCLGFIVRDGNICPVRIKSFKEISPMDQDHMWAMVQGGKDGNPPTLETMYFKTRRTKNKTLEEPAARKYDQITELRRSQPSISTIDLIETCFKPQKGHVICFGGAVKPKDLKSSQPSRAELITKFQQQRVEDATTFTNRIDEQQNSLLLLLLSFSFSLVILSFTMAFSFSLAANPSFSLATIGNVNPSFSLQQIPHSPCKDFLEANPYSSQQLGSASFITTVGQRIAHSPCSKSLILLARISLQQILIHHSSWAAPHSSQQLGSESLILLVANPCRSVHLAVR